MKNRTIIGILCIVIAVAITFLVAPLINKAASGQTEVLRLKADVRQGTQITKDRIETVKINKGAVSAGTLTKPGEVVGKYAASDLYAGDCIKKAKLTDNANTASDVLAALDGTKVAVSVTIDSFAAGLSGKLQNGDVVSLIVVDKNSNATIPGEFKYVKVITTTTAGGIDQDSVVKNEDGSYEIPSTITVLVNNTQAKLLARYESDYTVQVALVYRGATETAAKFLAKQEEFFTANPEGTAASATAPAAENAGRTGNGTIEQANDIIGGRADYYDVNEAVSANG